MVWLEMRIEVEYRNLFKLLRPQKFLSYACVMTGSNLRLRVFVLFLQLHYAKVDQAKLMYSIFRDVQFIERFSSVQ